MAGVTYAKKQGKQDINEDSDFGAGAAFSEATSPASVKAMAKGGKGGTMPGVSMKHDTK